MLKPFDDRIQSQLFTVSSLVLGVLIVLSVLLYFTGGVKITEFLPGCLFYRKYHLYCPGCGGTRAVRCLLRGDIIRSFQYHPFVPYAAIIYGIFFGSNVLYNLSFIRKRYMLRPIHFIGAVIIIVLQCLVKNLLVLVMKP